MKINIDNKTWMWIAFLACIAGATVIGTFGTWGASGMLLIAFVILIALLS
jgi:hypothetical protein